MIYEEALHRMVRALGPEVARHQVDLFIDVIEDRASWCDARTQVWFLPRESPLLTAPGDLTLLRFPPKSGLQDFLYIESEFDPELGDRANYTTDPAALATATAKWTRIWDAELVPKEHSAEWLGTLLHDYR